MEPIPRGAQFIRSQMLWEIALGMAGDPSIPAGRVHARDATLLASAEAAGS